MSLVAAEKSIAEEEFKPLSYIRTKVFPELTNSKEPSSPTVWRWSRKGIAGVRLEIAYCGSRPMCSVAAVRRFIAGVTAAKLSRQLPEQANIIKASDAELQAAGVL